MAAALPISIVIPTYRRDAVLVETLQALLALEAGAHELLVIDQTEAHDAETARALEGLAAQGRIRWVRQAEPSIPRAMNAGLQLATQAVVLFLDDDIRPEPGLIAAHDAAHGVHPDVIVAGKVIQPWDEGRDYSADTHFHFAAHRPHWIGEFMGGNFSLRRDLALAAGGFDENFVRVAYRFEAEFAHRWVAGGRRIYFEPAACLHHLKAAAGGTRTYGEHLTTWRPDHAVGAYYYGLRTRKFGDFAARPFRSVATRHHLRHPWQIPATLLAEFRGMAWALALHMRGPRHVEPVSDPKPK
ncbi:MAG: glycosyltransferase family 2 protein [Ramlibacter sp.]